MTDDGRTSDRPCGHCGERVPNRGMYCAACGAFVPLPERAVAPADPVSPSKPHPFGAKTIVFGSPSVRAPQGLAEPYPPASSPSPNAALPESTRPELPPPAPPDEKPAEEKFKAQRTMLGLSPNRFPTPGRSSPWPKRPQAATKLGVATPGIAPLRDPALDETLAAPTPPSPEPITSSFSPHPFAPPYVVPAPAPLSPHPAPALSARTRKRGIPLLPVVLLAGVLVASAGASLLLFFHASSAIHADPRVLPTGEDVLQLQCDPRSCRDGTTASYQGAKTAFVKGEASLILPTLLHVGENDLSLAIDRPGFGRDEELKVVVPVHFRVRADATALSASPPRIRVEVQALPGSRVTVDGKPLVLDGAGLASYDVDATVATEGPADESRVLAVDVPYTITVRDQPPERGTVTARAAIAPLRVDAPGAHAVVDTTHVTIAGRAAKGAEVRVNGAVAPLGEDGMFSADVPLPDLGDNHFEVRSATATLAARRVQVVVKRVASLAEEASAFERQTKLLGYDAATANLDGSVGAPIAVEGEVVDSRSAGHRTVFLIDDRRGCAKGPCLARVVLDEDRTLTRGTPARAFGHIARAFAAPGGRRLPEVEADFILAGSR